MELEITPDLEEMLQSIWRGGQYDSESAIIREALSLLRQRDQLKRDIQAGITELDRGERILGGDVFRGLEEKIVSLTKRAMRQNQ